MFFVASKKNIPDTLVHEQGKKVSRISDGGIRRLTKFINKFKCSNSISFHRQPSFHFKGQYHNDVRNKIILE